MNCAYLKFSLLWWIYNFKFTIAKFFNEIFSLLSKLFGSMCLQKYYSCFSYISKTWMFLFQSTGAVTQFPHTDQWSYFYTKPHCHFLLSFYIFLVDLETPYHNHCCSFLRRWWEASSSWLSTFDSGLLINCSCYFLLSLWERLWIHFIKIPPGKMTPFI